MIDSVNADDFDVLADPIWRKINPATVTALFDFLLDHFLSIDLKFGPIASVRNLPRERRGVWYTLTVLNLPRPSQFRHTSISLPKWSRELESNRSLLD